jgi:hypothetical protein
MSFHWNTYTHHHSNSETYSYAALAPERAASPNTALADGRKRN